MDADRYPGRMPSKMKAEAGLILLEGTSKIASKPAEARRVMEQILPPGAQKELIPPIP